MVARRSEISGDYLQEVMPFKSAGTISTLLHWAEVLEITLWYILTSALISRVNGDVPVTHIPVLLTLLWMFFTSLSWKLGLHSKTAWYRAIVLLFYLNVATLQKVLFSHRLIVVILLLFVWLVFILDIWFCDHWCLCHFLWTYSFHCRLFFSLYCLRIIQIVINGLLWHLGRTKIMDQRRVE